MLNTIKDTGIKLATSILLRLLLGVEV